MRYFLCLLNREEASVVLVTPGKTSTSAPPRFTGGSAHLHMRGCSLTANSLEEGRTENTQPISSISMLLIFPIGSPYNALVCLTPYILIL